MSNAPAPTDLLTRIQADEDDPSMVWASDADGEECLVACDDPRLTD
jgi:hypothetical protein